jgi:L-malate glycosyltransferase
VKKKTVLSVFCLRPFRIGATEVFARELSDQLAGIGWKSILCFSEEPPEDVRRFIKGPNVSIEVVKHPWDWNAAAAVRLSRIMKQHQPGIVHLYFTGFVTPYPWLAKLMGVARVYFTDQTSLPEGFVPGRAPLWKRLAVRAMNAPMDGVTSVSDFGLKAFLSRGLLNEKYVRLIYNSVDVTRAARGQASGAAFRRRHGITPDRLVITQVSSMIPEKGVHDLLWAARDVIAAEPRAHFVLVGDGPRRQDLTMLAKKLGIAAHTTFTGVVQDPLAEGVYAASDVACQVSRWEEAFGYVIAEAMASSKPVIGTRVGGIPELVAHGKTGFLVERGDAPAIADHILKLLRDANPRITMGEAGRKVAIERFNHKKNVAQVIEMYGIGKQPAIAATPAHEPSPASTRVL